ncbi:MAG: OmpH family outer membrane protein [Prevotella sp.]|nr:OmpH family outer membrane protein [Prevotella sp.]
MKKVILMLMLFAPVVAFAQKFGHVDTQSIVQSLPDFSRANGEIEAIGKQYENELQASQTEFQRLAEDYEKKKSSMNATQQQEQETKLQEMYTRIQQQAQQNQQEFQKAQQEKLQPILNKVRQAIETVGKSGGYVYIVETGSMLYINDTISKDLTAEVKAQLAKMKN